MKTKGLWESRFNENYFDVNPPAGRTLLVNESRSEAFKENESFEKNKYNQRITEVERAKFYPLASSTTGGAVPLASIALTQLASNLSSRKEDS